MCIRDRTWVLFLVGASGVAYLCLSILRPFAAVIAWSSVLAIICYPVHERLVRRTGRVALSAFISSALTVLAGVIPLLLVAGLAVNQFVSLGTSLGGALTGTRPLSRVPVSAPPVSY